jgi:hypothetical protein
MLLTDLISLCKRPWGRVRVTCTEVTGDGLAKLTFNLRSFDGSLMTGERTFPIDTKFDTFEQFEEQLWEGQLFETTPAECCGETPSLWWAVGGVALASALDLVMYEVFGANVTTPFATGVVILAIVFGTAHALLMACCGPILHNVLTIKPYLTLTPFTPREYFLAALCVVLALVVPALIDRGAALRGWCHRVEFYIYDWMDYLATKCGR